MKTDALSDIRSRLWNSAEMAHVRVQLIVWAAGYVLCLLAGCARVAEVPGGVELTAVLVSVLFAPMVGFWLIRTWRIFRRPEGYVFCRTELGQPHHAPLGRGLFSFMGVIETEADGRFAVETHAIFRSCGAGLLMEEYLGKTVTLAWNRATDTVVVIG